MLSSEENPRVTSVDEKMKVDSGVELQPPSIHEAELEDNRNGQFHRSFSPRQIHVRVFFRSLGPQRIQILTIIS